MGNITRLNTVFSNNKLPALIDRDVSAIEAEILKHKNLQGFWDFSDKSTMMMSGTSITRVSDKSTKGRNLTTSLATAPTLDNFVLGNMPSAFFDGSKHFETTENVFQANWKNMTIVAFAMKHKATRPANTILVSPKTSPNIGIYTNNVSLSSSGVISLNLGTLVGKPLNIINTSDFALEKTVIRTPNEVNQAVHANRDCVDSPLYVGKWADSGNPNTAISWNGYIGHVMIFDTDLELDPIFMNTLFEYARRKYGTPSWE